MKNAELVELLVNRRETLDVEIKNWLGGLINKDDKAKLAREIISLANNNGGYVLIGFSDDEGHPEVEPLQGELESYTQDELNGLVQRYVEPACQITVDLITTPELSYVHPIITVPGNHRTPVWAKHGASDSNILLNNTVYVRRSGACSEPPRSQDDWEKLIDRLVKARQEELISAMRTVLNPELSVQPENATDKLSSWVEESYAAWQDRMSQIAANDPRRFGTGYWTASFFIEEFDSGNLVNLNDHVGGEMVAYSGWRPFYYSHHKGQSPQPNEDVISAWLGYSEAAEVSEHEVHLSDYWRLSRDGKGYLVRPYQEDESHYCSNRIPRPKTACFDILLHPYRIAEILKVIQSLGHRFAASHSNFHLRVQYTGTSGRTLDSCDFAWVSAGGRGSKTSAEQITSEVSAPVEQISTNMHEIIVALLDSVYEKFEFSKAVPGIVTAAVDNVS